MKTNDFRFTLDPSSSKFECPKCLKRNLVCYIDKESGEYLPKEYGRCNSEVDCQYFLNPYQDGYVRSLTNDSLDNRSLRFKSASAYNRQHSIPSPQSPIPLSVLKSTWQGYDQNTFIQNLLHRIPYPIEKQDIKQLTELYGLGTITGKDRHGAITFPFVDINKNIRAIQAKQFDETNHTVRTDFVHSIIERDCKRNNMPLPRWLSEYQKHEGKVTCLFGEHLLRRFPHNPVALVEAPKTALIATLYFGFPDNQDDLIWLAVYNLSSLKIEKCRVLQGRKVILFPDLSKEGHAFQKWSHRAQEFNEALPQTRFITSTLLEKYATEQEKLAGFDLADFLIRQDWRKFRKKGEAVLSIKPEVVSITNVTDIPVHLSNIYAESLKKVRLRYDRYEQPLIPWDITTVEQFFLQFPLPAHPIKLEQANYIFDVALFVETHLSVVKANNGNYTYKPYFDRLIQLKEILSNLQNPE
ncbi:MAG: DUF6371 domain-containing protein [bacterium]